MALFADLVGLDDFEDAFRYADIGPAGPAAVQDVLDDGRIYSCPVHGHGSDYAVRFAVLVGRESYELHALLFRCLDGAGGSFVGIAEYGVCAVVDHGRKQILGRGDIRPAVYERTGRCCAFDAALAGDLGCHCFIGVHQLDHRVVGLAAGNSELAVLGGVSGDDACQIGSLIFFREYRDLIREIRDLAVDRAEDSVRIALGNNCCGLIPLRAGCHDQIIAFLCILGKGGLILFRRYALDDIDRYAEFFFGCLSAGIVRRVPALVIDRSRKKKRDLLIRKILTGKCADGHSRCKDCCHDY